MAKPPPIQGKGEREKGQGQQQQAQQGERLLEKPSTLPLPLPTYLLYSEAVELLVEKGGLRVTEARRVVEKIRLAPTSSSFRKWHYRDVLAKAEELRNNPEARA